MIKAIITKVKCFRTLGTFVPIMLHVSRKLKKITSSGELFVNDVDKRCENRDELYYELFFFFRLLNGAFNDTLSCL